MGKFLPNRVSRILAKTGLRGQRTSPRARLCPIKDSEEPKERIFVNSKDKGDSDVCVCS